MVITHAARAQMLATWQDWRGKTAVEMLSMFDNSDECHDANMASVYNYLRSCKSLCMPADVKAVLGL